MFGIKWIKYSHCRWTYFIKIWKLVFLVVLEKKQHVCLAREGNAGNMSLSGAFSKKPRGTSYHIHQNLIHNGWCSFPLKKTKKKKKKKRKKSNNNSNGSMPLAYCTYILFNAPKNRSPLINCSMHIAECQVTVILQGRRLGPKSWRSYPPLFCLDFKYFSACGREFTS